jgi:hypothetical protein
MLWSLGEPGGHFAIMIEFGASAGYYGPKGT